MDVTMASTQPGWPEFFRQTVVSNCHYWLRWLHTDANRVLREMPQVLRGLSYSLSLPEAWIPTRDLMLQLSPLMLRHGQGADWESFLTRSITRSSEEQDPAEIDLCLELGTLYRLQGRLPEAQLCFQQAFDLCDPYQSRTHYWTLLNHLGLVARLSAQHKVAKAYCRQVLTEPDLAPADRAEAFNVKGLIAYDRRQWEEALACFEKALALYHSLDDSYEIARILNNQGLVLLREKRWDEAEKSYQEAIQHFQASDDETERYKAVMNLGNVFLMRQMYKGAIQQYQAALPVFQQCNYLVDMAHINNNLGMAYTGLADWQVAEAYYLASIKAWRSLEDAHNLANVMDNFGDMLIKARQPAHAREVLNQALEILDTTADGPAKTFLQQEIEDRLTRINDSG